MIPILHFNGPIWRPPYEATSQLLQVTAGCTWHKCKFCTLYGTQKFRVSPMNEIEHDLQVIQMFQPRAHRIFLTGANPFVLTTDKLTDIALLIRKYIGRGHPTIGCFSRITDIRNKTIAELRQLHHLGFDYITIGVESGDSETLVRANKGYMAEDILEQCSKLDEAGIHYHFFYLLGLAGRGRGMSNAQKSATVFNLLHPVSIGLLSLTLFPESVLYKECCMGTYLEATEYERLDEMACLIENLNIRTHILARAVSNPIPLTGGLPHDRAILLHEIQSIKENFSEEQLRIYRENIKLQ